MKNNESIMRKMYNKNHNIPYEAITSLKQAREEMNVIVVFEGDYGGIIYLTCPIELVKCKEEQLKCLLEKIDKLYWNDINGANVFYEKVEEKSIAGGMDGGLVLNNLWIHPEIEKLGMEKEIKKTILG